jgi:hypothetical protein
MKTLAKLGLTALIAFGFNLSAQALVITPTTGTPWTGGDNSNLDADEIEDIVGTSLDLSVLYTQNVGGSEEGVTAYKNAYTTTFSNSAGDPEDALIDYISGTAITGFGELYLYVKDGNQDPAFYIFNISGWNGTDDLKLENFWVGNGAISHVSILGGGTPTTNVPDGGATVALLGLALGGIGYVRRKLTA